jgi:hypothetical protein
MANYDVVVLQSASRTVAPTGLLEQAAVPPRQYVEGIGNLGTGWALVVVVDATANPGGLGSITVTISGYDKASGKTWPILVGAAIVTVSTNVYRVAVGLATAANAAANDIVPPQIKISVAHNNANPITYSVGAHLVG